jgi:hypothetical protein
MSDLSSIGSIAAVITSSFTNLSPGISGNVIVLVDSARQYVSQYTGNPIDATAIPQNVQNVIFNFALADVFDFMNADGTARSVSLSELNLGAISLDMTSQQYRKLGDIQLKVLGKNYKLAQSISY